jgi:NhaP-type Na+/H+ or K+/H+ antiporter
MSTGAGGSTESNVTSFVAFLKIYLSIITQYFIIKLSLIKKPLKKRNNEIITQYLTGVTVV